VRETEGGGENELPAVDTVIVMVALLGCFSSSFLFFFLYSDSESEPELESEANSRLLMEGLLIDNSCPKPPCQCPTENGMRYYG
jgi:hypothetical protein